MQRPSTRSAALLLVAGLLLAACSQPHDGPYQHVILISLDTTRADHLGCYGSRVQTPNIDRLAGEGVVFLNAMAPAPTTLASHTSMMTGTYPHTSGIVRNGFMVHGENEMLAEVLGREGFYSAAFLGSFALESRFDFDQGFEWFDERFEIAADLQDYDQYQRRAEHVTDAVLAHLDEPHVKQRERLFLFVHYFDAHTPYNPQPPYNGLYGAELETSTMADVDRMVRAHESRQGVERNAQARLGQGLARELVERAPGEPLGIDRDLAALYAGEVSYVDHHVGRLLDGLRERKLLDQAVVVLTADHGETFWEHADSWNHGLWCYQTTVHVPLVLRLPTGEGAGTALATPVSGVDVLPTLLDVLGIGVPPQVEGVSLLPAVRGEPFERGPIFCNATQPFRDYVTQGALRWPNLPNPRCVRIGDYKYILTPYADDLRELYDLAADPGERRNLLTEGGGHQPEVLAALEGALEAWTNESEALASTYNASQVQEVMRSLRDKTTRDALGGLGYAQDEDLQDDDETGGNH